LITAGTLVGKYQIQRLLGQGGMGTVYLAFDPLIEREVAIKLLSPDLSANAESLRRFLGEARSIGRMSHPNVVSIFAIDIWEGQYYLVMELLTGGSVAELSERRGRLPYSEAARLLAQAARGLSAAHAAGMVHRDIKPANLMLSRDGVVKVVDFGLSRILDGVGAGVGADAATRVGQIMGTPHYMSPEQFDGGSVDARSDIYSLGATFFRLITGEFPFQRCGTIVQLMKAHLMDAPPAASSFDAQIPSEVDDVIGRAMAKRPEDRFGDAAEFAEALERLAGAGQSVALAGDAAALDGPSFPAERMLKSVVVAERSSLQSKMLQTSMRAAGISEIQVFTRIEQADAAVAQGNPDVIWTAMELDDARGVDWLRRLGRRGRTGQCAVVLHSSDTEVGELPAAVVAPCRLSAPKTVPPDQVLRLLHAAGPFRVPSLVAAGGLDCERALRVLSDTERLPEELKGLIRELQLMNVQLAGMLDVSGESAGCALSLIVRTAESFVGDELAYGGLVSGRRPELTAALQHSQRGLFLRAVGRRGAVAYVCRPFGVQAFRSLLEAVVH
jgi:CheY-like chemotaxis protein